MQSIPEEVETAFLKRTIKGFTWVRIDGDVKAVPTAPIVFFLHSHQKTMFAFTQVESNSDEGRKVYESMARVLQCILEDMRNTNIEEEEDTTENPLTPI